ncbi:glutamate--cysteine ligase [Halomarina salina]|uniref:Glutamate--cysteine ligase n=1 Tax=Halomarina salina TaxID=1872699 RepID=A0ABD5RSL4_9EURY|nr:glutamate--cysteine ligase [Halomarina salina]
MEELGSADAFDRMGTLGIEEEFFVVDAEGRPTSGTDELVYESDPPEILDGRLDHELFKCVIETQTPTLAGLDDAAEALAEVRAALVDHAERHGFGIAAAGLHPAAHWRELEHADKERYRAQLDRIQYPQHRNTTAGLHVHVGVDDAEKATWVSNRLRWHLPLLLALSVNSPYWNGFDTGLASARSVVFENLPNTGMPTTFGSFEDYQRLERLMVETDSISDRGELWYDVRPHTGHGTVEVRTPDAQCEEWRVLAFAEYVRALVVDYAERYEDHPDPWSHLSDHRRETLDENKWRATRWGRDASFIDRDCESTVSLADAVDAECDRLGVTGIREVLDAEDGATAQRRLRESGGLDAVCGALRL